jgi:peptidoglycan hydrolase-like protein with peptidoglycan-binding domain
MLKRRRDSFLFGAAALLAASTLAPVRPVFARAPITVPRGTTMDVRVETPIDTNTVRPGDEFKASVVAPVVVAGNAAIPSGTTVHGNVSDVVANRSFGRASGAIIRIDSLTSPTGASVAIVGSLTDNSGNPLATLDNIPRGARLRFTLQRDVTVDDAFYGGPQGGDDVFNSPETISQVQVALRDLGYYTGRIDGRLTPPTRQAIAQFQREQRLNETGYLDRDTLARLGLISETGTEVSAVNVISAVANVRANNELSLHIVTQGANAMTIFEDHIRQRDAIHVYVRGFRNARSPRGTSELDVTLRPEEWRGIDRIVVHGSGNDIVIRAADMSTGAPFTAQEASDLEARITNLLQQYSSDLGLRFNRFTGQMIFSPNMDYHENETELLFALNSTASSARLYTQLLRSSNDPQAIRGATDVFAAQVRTVERAITRTRSPRAANTISGWQALRDQLRRLAQSSDNETPITPRDR